jgi:prepilin-type N-terminal cleavage/methylation domain-containing protein
MWHKRAFTLIEILAVIAIIAAVSTIAVYFFGNLNKAELLKKDADSLVAFIRNARLFTISSKNASQYGVHLEANKAVLFQGSVYTPGGEEERIHEFSNNVEISTYSLNMGGQDIVFKRLTGFTDNYGTVKIQLKDGSASTTITILGTGVVK